MSTRFIAPLVAVVAFVVRFLLVGAIENDHYVYLARAHQVLFGDWPVRNFADPGMPLAYLLSAAAAAIATPTLLTDVVVSVALFAIGATATFALARRASGSLIVALIAIAAVIAMPPRLYNSSKMMVPVVAMVLAWAYADRPTLRRAAALGAWTGIAFLFRHDYAAYVGVAALLLLLVRHWGERTALVTAIGMYGGAAAAVVTPWLVYVATQQGLPEYLAAAMRFSVAERHRTVSRWPLVFYLTAAVPLAALIVGIRGTRYLTTAHVLFATVLVLLSELVLLRDAPGARLPDVVATTVVVAAILAGRFIRPATRNLYPPPSILVTTALVAVAAIALIAVRGRAASAVPTLGERWHQVTTRLRDATPDIMPDPRRAPLVQFINRCTNPDERVLVGGFAPELPVLAHRAFAGGLPDWIPGYYEHPSDVARARAQLGRERVGLAVMLDGGDAFAASWPAVAADLRARGLTRYALPLETGPVELWVRPATTKDSETGLPCELVALPGADARAR